LKLARLRAEQNALLADIRVETDDEMKGLLKEQFKVLANRISELAAVV
jgi:hypothetical protein